VVVVAEEDRAAIVAALDHMQRLVGQEVAAEASQRRLPAGIDAATVVIYRAPGKKSYSDRFPC
jgi:hypothetical protein